MEKVHQILVHEPQDAKEHTIAAVALAPKREAVPIDKTVWGEHMAGIEKGMERLMLYRQVASEMNANTLAGPYGNYRSVGNTAVRGRSYQPMPGSTTGNVKAGANQPEAGGAKPALATYSDCRWCGADGHLKYQCADYGGSHSGW